MDLLLVALQFLWMAPVLVRVARMRGGGEHTGAMEELAASLRRPVLTLHGLGILLVWAAIALAIADRQVSRAVTARGALGAALLVCAALLITWSVATLRSWRLIPKVGAGHELCTRGPYALVRNPIYLALDLAGIGSAVWVGSALAAVGALAIAVFGDLRARQEEKVLQEAYGERYRDYLRRVRRTIPFLY